MTIKQNGGVFGRNPEFSDVTADELIVDNIKVDGNTVSALNTNGDVILQPNGTGAVSIPNTLGKIKFGNSGLQKSASVDFGGSAVEIYRNKVNFDNHLVVNFFADTIFERRNSEKFRITTNGVTFNGDTAAANALDD
jgi:hypothetical protein